MINQKSMKLGIKRNFKINQLLKDIANNASKMSYQFFKFKICGFWESSKSKLFL